MAELRNDGKFLDAWDVYAHIVIQSIAVNVYLAWLFF
jgi:hypothetical protein